MLAEYIDDSSIHPSPNACVIFGMLNGNDYLRTGQVFVGEISINVANVSKQFLI